MEFERELDLAALDLLPAEQGLTGGCIIECDNPPAPPTTICCGSPGHGTWCTGTIPHTRTQPV
jgi:hypothetical protein